MRTYAGRDTTADIYSHLNYTSKLNVAGVITNKFRDEINIEKDEEEIEIIETKKGP